MATGTSFAFSNTVNDGDDITHTLWNAAFAEFITQLDVSGINDDMADATAMQTTSDPYSGDTAQLPATLQVLLQQYAFQLDALIGATYWYEDPTWSINGSGITIANGVLTETGGGASIIIQMSHSATNTVKGLGVKHLTSADMTDGFGSVIVFLLEDDASGSVTAGDIRAIRDGADTTSKIQFAAYDTGSIGDIWTLDHDGNFYPETTNSCNVGGSGNEIDQIWADSIRTAGTLKLYSAATYWTLETDGDLIPVGAYDLGASGSELDQIWADSLRSAGTLKLYSGSTYWTLENDGDLIPAGNYDVGDNTTYVDNIWFSKWRMSGGANYWSQNTDGDFLCSGSNTQDIASSTNRSGTVYCATLDETSDERLKNIVGKVDHALDFINAMKPILYTWKEGEDTETVLCGFSAQQIENDCGINHGFVRGSKDTAYGLSNKHLSPYIVKAIQEIMEQLNNIEKRLTALEVK